LAASAFCSATIPSNTVLMLARICLSSSSVSSATNSNSTEPGGKPLRQAWPLSLSIPAQVIPLLSVAMNLPLTGLPLAYLYSTCTQCGLSGSIIWVFTLHGGKMLPLFIPTHSGEQYQLLARGHTPSSCGDPVSNIDTSFLFSIIAREISIPVEQWRSFLM